MHFKDHFSKQASGYHTYRPHYPDELFAFLASCVSRHDTAWDCATGNGQAAHGLARHFQKIIATDGSEQQLAQAVSHERISYRKLRAEKTDFAPESIDLITVAQALHWFDFAAFYAEAERVLHPHGAIAIWGYYHSHIAPEVDKIVRRFSAETVGPYWPPERKFVEEHYRSIPFPFAVVQTPEFKMRADWSLDQLIGYLNTWSSVQRYKEKYGKNPVDEIQEDLAKAWGAPGSIRKATWPLFLYVGRLKQNKFS